MPDHDFDLPMTEAFVARVRRGVRRRKMFRLAAAGAAVVLALGGATLAVRSVPAPTPTPVASPTVSSTPLDGYEVRYVPDGIRATERDSVGTYAVSPNRLRNDGPAPSIGEPSAAVTMRIFVRGNGGNYLWITVLRPERTTPAASREQITQWLVGWSTGGARPDERFPAPAGEAQLISYTGTETTTHDIVIATPDGVVITVGGAGTVPVTDLKAVALGIHPA